MRKFYLLSCAIVLSIGAIAQEIETIYTSSGDVYNGYISEQVPGSTVSVYATDATLVLAVKDIVNLRDEYRKTNNLSPAAQKYFMAQGDSAEYKKLCSFDYLGTPFDDVLKINQTNDSLYIRVLTNRTYHLAWNTITKVKKILDEDTITGMLDIVGLESGNELRGRVLGQVMGKSMTIQLTDGTQKVVSASNITSIRSEVNDIEDVFAHVPLLDVIVLKNDSIEQGVIISRMMGEHITIMRKDTSDKIIPLKDIKCYRKIQNPAYIGPLVAKKENEDSPIQVFVGGVMLSISPVMSVDGEEDKKKTLVSHEQTIKKSDSICVEVENVIMDTVCLYKLREDKSILRNKHIKFMYFSLTDRPYIETYCTKQENNSCLVKFSINEEGKYILLIDNTKGIILNIE